MVRRQITVLILVLALAGCGTAPHEVAPTPGESAGKPTSHSQILASARRESLSNRDALMVDLRFSSWDPVARVRVTTSATGAISVVEGTEFTWEDIPAKHDIIASVRLSARENGTGILRVAASVYTEGGEEMKQEWTSRQVSFLITPEEVLAGTGGLYALQIQHLNNMLAAGKLTQRQYNEERKKLELGTTTP